jgi:hypothetical protein
MRFTEQYRVGKLWRSPRPPKGDEKLLKIRTYLDRKDPLTPGAAPG